VIGRKLGGGNFGTVFEATLTGQGTNKIKARPPRRPAPRSSPARPEAARAWRGGGLNGSKGG
jgi:hypothetical protein